MALLAFLALRFGHPPLWLGGPLAVGAPLGVAWAYLPGLTSSRLRGPALLTR